MLAKDGSEALVTFVQVLNRPNFRSRRVRLQGLDPNAYYRLETSGQVYSGGALLYGGLPVPALWGDFKSCLFHLLREQKTESQSERGTGV